MKNDYFEIIKAICQELKIEYQFLSKDWVILLRKRSTIRFISGYKFDLNPHALGSILDDKFATYEILNQMGFHVIKHHIVYSPYNHNPYAMDCNNIEYLTKLFYEYNKDVVLKVNNGTCGNQVERITSLEALEHCFQNMKEENTSFSLCPYYEACSEFRAIVLKGKMKLMYQKEKPVVIGNGKSTLKELLTEFNPSYFNKHSILNADRILKKGECYSYDWKFNLSKGARMKEEISKEDRRKVSFLVLSVCKKLQLGFCSVDIIKTIDNNFYILEINSGVMMKHFINQANNGYEKAYAIYKEALLEMFSEEL